MVQQRTLPNFVLADGEGGARSFHDFLADFNILVIRRVPEPSHGPATEFLRSLLAENRGVEGVAVRGFDIRSPDSYCETCAGPHVVFQGRSLLTICDSGSIIRRLFGIVQDDGIFVIGADRHVIDAGTIAEVGRLGIQLSLDVALSRHHVEKAPPELNDSGRKDAQK